MAATTAVGLENITLGDCPPELAADLAALFRRHPVASAGLGYHVERSPDPFALPATLGTGYRLFAARAGDEVVGTVTLVFDRVYRQGAAIDVAYGFDLKVDAAWRGTGLADRLMRQAYVGVCEQLGPDAAIVTAFATDNNAGAKKVSNLGRDNVIGFSPFAKARLHVMLPAVPPLQRWAANDVKMRQATQDDVEAMMGLWARHSAPKDLARAYTPERFSAWMQTPGLTFWLACDRQGTPRGFLGLWDQSAVRRFVLGDASGIYHAARHVWTLGRVLAGLPALPLPGERLPFRGVVNMCVPADAPNVLAALLCRGLDQAREEGALFVGLALDATDPLNAVADRFWTTRSELYL